MNSLEQGKLFEKLSSNYRKITNNGLQNISSNNIVEGFTESSDTNTTIEGQDDSLTNRLVTLREQANNQIEEYRRYLTIYKEQPDNIQNLNSLSITNEALKETAEDIYELSETIKTRDNTIKTYISNTTLDMNNTMDSLNKTRQELMKEQQERNSLVTNYNINERSVTSLYYKYLAWTIGAITLAGITGYKIINRD